jgi:hypothetical protein
MSTTAMPDASDSSEEECDSRRRQFRVRLRREQTTLTTLIAALENAKIDSALALADIGGFAHRLRAAALVCGFAGIGDLARAVERAADPAAPGENGQRNDPPVECTMRALAKSLTEETTRGAPCEPAARLPSW